MTLNLRFFEPNKRMIKWLQTYIGDRTPIDVGCGGCDLLVELGKGGIGIDPLSRVDGIELMNSNIQFIPMPVQYCGSIIRGLHPKAIVIIARPCHSSFIEDTIDLVPNGMEVLYITKPENIYLYSDLGEYDSLKKLINHKGKGSENEVVYSIIKK